MISRLHSLLIAGACGIGFAVTLALALHGAIVALLALGFFFFASAAADRKPKWLVATKRVFGGLVLATCVFAFIGGDQNFSLLATVSLSATFLAFDPTACWITRPTNESQS
jgi:hypothetical protein